VETEVSYHTDWGLSAQVNGRFSRIRTSRPNAVFGVDLEDSLPGVPAFSGGAVISYERPMWNDWTLRFVGQTTYIGPSRISFDDTQRKTGGYARTKLSAELSNRNFGVQVYVLNPTDARSDTFAFGNPFSSTQALTRQITPQRPRTVGITLTAAI
jgi:hypothetical protein